MGYVALLLQIDVHHPYGRQKVERHIASRISSDYYLPRMRWLRYLEELWVVLNILNANSQCLCFLPQVHVSHDSGLQINGDRRPYIRASSENSRSAETFDYELSSLQQKLGRGVTAFSKHGSAHACCDWHWIEYCCFTNIRLTLPKQ